MSYVSLYRAYRPSNFDEISGQIHVVKTLKNAVVSNKVSHAYLFSGPRGTGKTSIAKIVAKAVNCLDSKDGNPCNKCKICVSINENKASDIIEMDAASNSGIDDIRDLKDKVRYLPAECKYKVYIIDEAHALTTRAYDALLKTLEEPPGYVIFILATTEPYNVPVTILSRTQIFDFKGLDMSDIEQRIKFICKEEKVEIADDAVHNIALLADGGMRDALSLLDQTISYSTNKVTIEEVDKISGSVSNKLLIKLVDNINNNNASESLKVIDLLIKDGKEINRIISDLINFYRDILLFKSNYESKNLLFKNEEFQQLARETINNKVYFYVDTLADTQVNIRKTNQKRTYLEMSIIKMSDVSETSNIDVLNKINALTKRINELEINGVSKVKVVLDDKASENTKIESNNGDYIKIEEIQEVLNNSNKENKLKLTEFIPSIKEHTENAIILKALSKITVCAFGNDTLLLAHDNIAMCDKLMQLEYKEDLIEILKKSKVKLDDYLVITSKQWKTILDDFLLKFKNDKKPILEPLEINIRKYIKRLDPFEPEVIRKAKELFPHDLIEIEE